MSGGSGRSFPDVVVQGLVRNQDEVLMIRRGNEPYKGWWALPGGGAEVRETLEGAVCREVLEETGVEVEVVEQIGIFESVDTPRHFIIVGYSARAVGSTDAKGGDDALEAAWVPTKDLGSLSLTPDAMYFLNRGLST